MRMLVCDTSNTTCCAGIYDGTEPVAYRLSMEKKTHSETFMPLVHEVMEEAGIKHEELDCYAVTVGPGSFTGIRIGLAAVKGMALAAGKNVIPVSSLAALARSVDNATAVRDDEVLIIPAFDARNGRVFACAAEFDSGKVLVPETADYASEVVRQVLAQPEIIYGTRHQLLVVGNGADAMKEAFEKAGARLNIYYAPGAAILPVGVARAAESLLTKEGNAAAVNGREIKACYLAKSRIKKPEINKADVN